MFVRHEKPYDSLKIGKRANLPIVSVIHMQCISRKEWNQIMLERNNSGKEAGELLSVLESGEISKKFIFHFFHNVDRIKLEKVDDIQFQFGIKEENIKEDEVCGLCHGEFVYEHDDKIYNIPDEIKVIDDIFWGMKPWGFKTLGHEIRKMRRQFR